MGMRINTNMSSIAAQRTLTKQQARMEHSQEALASGNRIVHASDDAAGLAISENIKGQVAGIKMARQNAYNATSLIQVSEGGLSEVSNILNRLRELGVQAASDTVGEQERGFINQEAQQLLQESDRIAKSTRFGNKTLLDGSTDDFQFHVGPYADEAQNTISFKSKSDATNSALGISSMDLTDKAGARDVLGIVDEALNKVGAMRADFGSVQSRLQTTVSSLDVQYENLSAAKSRIADADVAYESAEMTSAQILQQASVATLAHANQNGSAALRLLQ
jgi:flagellin